MYRSPTSGDDPGDARERSPSLDDVLSVLNHPLRREVVRYCAERSVEQTDLDTVADHLASEHDREDRDRIALRLHHLHLPKLADTGVVEFDPTTGQIRYRSDDTLETVLARIQGER